MGQVLRNLRQQNKNMGSCSVNNNLDKILENQTQKYIYMQILLKSYVIKMMFFIFKGHVKN